MRQRTAFSITLAVAALLALAAPVCAGGWAVVTLDTLPREVRAGQTLHLGFMVRQHGVEPNSGVSPILTAIKQAAAGSAGLVARVSSAQAQTSQEATTVRAEARQEGPEGHFVVDVTFPSAGTWEWKITPEPFGPTTFAPLTVLSAAPTGTQPAPVVQPELAATTLRIEPATFRLAGVLLLAAAVLAALSGLRAGSRKPAAEA